MFVVVEELSQGFVPRRSLDPTDLTADLVGIVIGTLAAQRLHRRWQGQVSPPADSTPTGGLQPEV